MPRRDGNSKAAPEIRAWGSDAGQHMPQVQ